MITLSKSGSTVTFTFDENSGYLQNGTIEVPVNSLSLVIDDSDMATFKKSASNDIFISARYEEFGKTKAELESWYKENMVGSTGGGGGVTPEEVQGMIDESISGKADTSAVTESITEATSGKADIGDIPDVSNYFDGAEYDSGTTRINFYHGNTVKAYIDASAFVIDGMIDDVRIETISGVTYLVIDFNTASGKEDIQIPLTDIFDPSNYYTKTEVDASLSGKVDTTTYSGYTAATDTAIDARPTKGNTLLGLSLGQETDGYFFQFVKGDYTFLPKQYYSTINNSPVWGVSNKSNLKNWELVETSTYSAYTANTATEIGNKLAVSDFNSYSGAVDTAINSKASESDLSALTDVVSAHTANTDIHVTTAQTAAWNAKSDFSGSYNDLTDKPTIPTVPTSNTAFTNDAGYATSGYVDSAVSGKVNTTTYTAYTAATDTVLSGKADTTAVTEAISAATSGLQPSLTAGRAISISNNTVALDLPISAGTASASIQEGYLTVASGGQSHAEGNSTVASGSYSHAEGQGTSATTYASHTEGVKTIAKNFYEHASGRFNVSNTGSTDADKTLFSVGNGENENTRHNAFEIRWNGDIYISSGNTDIKLQDNLGGVSESAFTAYTAATDTALNGKQATLVSGTNIKTINNESLLGSGNIDIQGGSITVDTALDSGSTNPVENRVIYDKFDEVESVTAAGLNALNDKFDGLKLKKLTQAQYDALSPNYDNATLYVIIN